MRWLVVVAASFGLAAALAISDAGQSATVSEARRCAPDEVPAKIGGRQRCLALGTACRARLNPAFHRYFFHCAFSHLDYWWEGLRRRPVNVPAVVPGKPCGTSSASGDLAQIGTHPAIRGPAWGPGPAYPWGLTLDGGKPVLRFEYPPRPESGWAESGWGGTKVLWVIAASYHGPVLVRGRQLDGPNEARFQDGRPGFTRETALRPPAELRLTGPETRANPATTRLRAPGCYAYQVDGRRFSYLIVFEARLVTPASQPSALAR
jgi:hypothetical protein